MCLRQPFDQALHGVDLFGFGRAVLLRPALDLPRDIVFALAEVAQADFGGIEAVKLRDGGVHRVIDGGALGRIEPGHLRLPEHAAVDKVHDVERRTGHALVGAIDERLRDRKALRVQRADDAVFAVDRMRGGQQFAGRLPPQHVAASRRLQQVSRVRLPALELPDRQRSGEACDIRGEIAFEACDIDPQRGRHILGAGEHLLAVDRRHRATPSLPRPERDRRVGVDLVLLGLRLRLVLLVDVLDRAFADELARQDHHADEAAGLVG